MFDSWFYLSVKFLVLMFVALIGMAVLAAIVMYVVDKTQRKHTIRRNFPVIGRFRWVFEHLGEFFRQYFFAQDREELPFNRAQRTWVYKAAKDSNNTVAFGSTRNLDRRGAMIFMNCAFPVMQKDAVEAENILIGPYAKQPYKSPSFFNISAMSFGALSMPAVQSLSHGAKKAGIWMNTGEGGISSYHLEGGCDIVYQFGTAKYGARNAKGGFDFDKLKEIGQIPQVKMIELKLAQGAKPGKGGILPAKKVTAEIANIRGIPAGVASVSPNRHPEIQSAHELLDMLNKIRDASGLPVGFKMVMGNNTWLHELFAEIHLRGIESAPDFITLDSGDGGTGAAPQSLMDDVGMVIKESLPMLVDLRDEYGLKERVRIMTSGKLITPAEVAWALCAGADFINNARGFLFSLGCIQAFKCNKNTCPTGITTHNPDLHKGLVVENKTKRVANFAKHMIKEVGVIAHSCGVTEPRALQRSHVRMVFSNSISKPLDMLFPNKRSKYD
ncbi:Ferredoxin-dependent glutamate synthase [hydrothermal vent metagenome]|uniref:Ferredoxin-dependent glutamate synthase n=1 Tax=hydrothermal vent metagenome TaxID=652676 RepID=A0A3B0VAX0_9ZZZZ